MGDILVTGGTGFLGRALLRMLVGNKHRPVALVRSREASDEIVAEYGSNVLVLEVDLSDAASVRAALRSRKPSAVFHLAGGRVPDVPHELSANLAANVAPTLALIEGLDLGSLTAFVLASTGEVYGPQLGPFHESLLTQPATAYSASKSAAEAFVLGAHRAVGLPAIVARMSVVYGPGPWASGAGRSATGMLLPQLMVAALTKNTFPMSAGTQTRDFLYVEDAVRALIELSETPGAVGQIVNVGAGQSTPIAEAARELLRALKRPMSLDLGALPQRPNEILDYRLVTERLKSLTQFVPRWPLKRGLEAMARGG